MAATAEGCPVGDYRERLIYFKDTDAEKNDMINRLIERLEKSQAECKTTASDLESEQDQRRTLQNRVKTLENLTTRKAFALVLIDADADDYIFHERFLDRNEIGGKEAADELRARIKEYLESLSFDTDSTDIVVRAYANLKGLRAACVRNGKMSVGAGIGLFAQGFTRRQPLFDFVDVGPGKEEADNKIKECLNFFVGNLQCKHIVLGVCHDAGYKPHLESFASDPLKRDRITLLEGAAVHRSIAALGFPRTLRLDTVFTPHVVPVLPAVPVGESSTRSSINPSPQSGRLGPVLRNEDGQRVDKMLDVDISSPYLDALRRAKLCQWYYLRGKCEGCKNNHVASPLSAREFDFLWYVARQGLCYRVRKGNICDDVLCIYRHEADCQIGSGRI